MIKAHILYLQPIWDMLRGLVTTQKVKQILYILKIVSKAYSCQKKFLNKKETFVKLRKKNFKCKDGYNMAKISISPHINLYT